MDANKIFECFFPYDYKCTQKLYDDQIQLAHYTTAEALHNILKNGYVWLRNVSVMNDYDISTMTDEDFLNTLKYFIRFSIVSMKHPGFDKEKEWRVFGHKNDINMAGLYSDIECIKGIIQPVFKLRFAITEKDEENCDIYLSQLLDKIIVGPTQQAYYATSKLAIAQALSQYYETAEDAISKIFISSIPYRVI